MTERVRITWTVTAECYADDQTALIEDATTLMYDGLMGGYALDATVKRTSVESVGRGGRR